RRVRPLAPGLAEGTRPPGEGGASPGLRGRAAAARRLALEEGLQGAPHALVPRRAPRAHRRPAPRRAGAPARPDAPAGGQAAPARARLGSRRPRPQALVPGHARALAALLRRLRAAAAVASER